MRLFPAFTALAAAQSPARTGVFSPVSVLFIVLIILLGLVMLVALMVLAMTGRFGAAKPDADTFQAQLGHMPAAGDESTENATPGKPGAAKKRPAALLLRLWRSGLASALIPVLLIIPAVAVFYGLENIYGQLSAFTPGAALLLALLAAQVLCVCRLARFLRKNR